MTTGIVSVSAERQKAAAIADRDRSSLAQLNADLLAHVLDCQRSREQSAKCALIEATVDGVSNNRRPYLSWECCDDHMALKQRRAELRELAAARGIGDEEFSEMINRMLGMALTD